MREGLMARPQEGPAMATADGAPIGEGEASPEEQAQYDTVMQLALKMLHSKQTRDAVFAQLKGGADDIGPAIGEMAYQIFSVIDQTMQKKGAPLSDAVRMEAAEDIIAELVQMAVLAKLVPDDEEAIGVVMTQAIDVAASRYGNDARESGAVDPNVLRGALQELSVAAQQTFAKKPMAQAIQGGKA